MKKLIFLFFLILSAIASCQKRENTIEKKILDPFDEPFDYVNEVMPFEYFEFGPDYYLVLNLRRMLAFKSDIEMIVIKYASPKVFKVKYYCTTYEITCASMEDVKKNPKNFRELFGSFDNKICPSFGKLFNKLLKMMIKNELGSTPGDVNENELLMQTYNETIYIKRFGWEGWKLDRYIDKIFKELMECLLKKDKLMDKERKKAKQESKAD